MSLLRSVAAATALEAGLGAALLAALGLGGAWFQWLDAINHFAPFILLLALLGGGLGVAVLRGRARRLVLALAFVGLAVPLGLMAPDLFARARTAMFPAPAGARPLKLLTYNVWTENIDIPKTADLILAADADVVTLQENNALEEVRDRLAARYPYRVSCEPNWRCGLSILSKRPLTNGAFQARPTPEDEYAFQGVWATTTAPDGSPITFVTTHFAWSVPPGAQARQRAGLAMRVKALAADHPFVTGDLNLTPWSFALRGVDGELAPATRRTRALFSWPAITARLNRPFPAPFAPIDHIYAPATWRTVKVERLARGGSDHYGVLATFTRDGG